MHPVDFDRIADDHDCIWARLPFLGPMAVKLAEECRTGEDRCGELAALVIQLRALLLDHLDHEEHILAGLALDVGLARAELAALHEEHVAISALLGRIRAALDRVPGDLCATERALRSELARLDGHVRGQVAVEERMLAGYVAAAAREAAGCPGATGQVGDRAARTPPPEELGPELVPELT